MRLFFLSILINFNQYLFKKDSQMNYSKINKKIFFHYLKKTLIKILKNLSPKMNLKKIIPLKSFPISQAPSFISTKLKIFIIKSNLKNDLKKKKIFL
jgi:hypothetical protein